MKTIFIIFILIFIGFGLPVNAASGDDLTNPMMVDHSNGWWKKSTEKSSIILHTRDGGRHWIDVSPPALAIAVKKMLAEFDRGDLVCEIAALCPLDAQHAWVSVTQPDSNTVLLEYTADAGRRWRESIAPIATENASISFVGERNGFLLATSSPAAGHMDKKVYGTVDGGKRWSVLTPPPAPGCYPTGISFRSPSDGWITATYHGGDDAPLYRTQDGGKSWKLQKLNVPGDYQGGYVDTYPPVFIGPDKKRGYLPVKLVRHAPKPGHYAWVTFETVDGGITWHVPASGVASVLDD
jgi:hypothetical protein